jgi:uncharacterized protein
MSKSRRSLALLAYCSLYVLQPVGSHAADAVPVVDGTWEGTLNIKATSLRMVMMFSRDTAGALVGDVASPDQSPLTIDMDVATFDGQTLHVEIQEIGAVFDGTLQGDPPTLAGTWSQAGVNIPVTLHPSTYVERVRPQEPIPPFPYDEEEVTFENVAAGVTFAGTLTKPNARGRHPAVLLITGSGAQNRNEELAGHRPFMVIADALTRRGIAVLRVDDRGVGGSGGRVELATLEDSVSDVLAGLAYLKRRHDIDACQIGLLGHSEGAEVAPAVAARSRDVAFVVMLAGPGVSGAEIIPHQTALILKADGYAAEFIEFNVALLRAFIRVVLREPNDAEAIAQITAL